MMHSWPTVLSLWFASLWLFDHCHGFTPNPSSITSSATGKKQMMAATVAGPLRAVPKEMQEKWVTENFTIDKALEIIEKHAKLREDSEELYSAVRFIDRNAHKLYREEDRKAIFEKAKGSWELRMGYEDSHFQEFLPYPDFRDFASAFIIIEQDYFGKGICQNPPTFAFVAMGGPAEYNPNKRQLYMNYKDFYISGREMPEWDLSYFMRGYARNWYESTRKRPPLAFTLIGANDNVLIVRGSKTGGMAIFLRMEEDMTGPAYGR